MKWFTHDNDLHDSPPMQGIIAELGWAGYGRALALLETLAKFAPNNGKFRFALPLAKPMDVSYWARELSQSVEDTERMFDVFQDVALIQPWRKTKTLCAPMLGDRLDEWSKRKKKTDAQAKKRLPNNHQKQLPPPSEHQEGHTHSNEHSNGHGHENGHGHKNEHEDEDENEHQHQHQHKHNTRECNP